MIQFFMRAWLALFFVVFSLNGSAIRDGIFLQGADEAVSQALLKQNPQTQVPEYLLPSHRERIKPQVRFFRLMDNYGDTANPRFPIHHQMFQGEHQFAHPQDPIAALIQTLYPSPNRLLFLANQAAIDPVSLLTPKKLGTILRILRNETSSTDEDASIPQEQKHKQLCDCLHIRHREVVTEKYDTYLEQELNGGPFDNYINTRLRDFRKLRFVNVLSEAFHYKTTTTLSKTMYVENSVEMALVSYAWDKATSLDDLEIFYQAVFDDATFCLPRQFYGKADFDRVYALLNDSENIVEALDDLSKEEQSLALHGSQHFDPYGFYFDTCSSVFYQGKPYTNCVETTISYFFMAVAKIYDNEKGIVFDHTVFPSGSPAYQYFRDFSTIDEFLSPKGRQAWCNKMVEKPGIRYVKKLSPKDPACFELRPGIQNIHNMMLYMLGRDTEVVKASDSTQRLPWGEVEQRFKETVASFSRDGFEIKLETEKPTYDEQLQDYIETLSIEINQNVAFSWFVQKNHSSLMAADSYQSNTDWKERYNEKVIEDITSGTDAPIRHAQNVALNKPPGDYYNQMVIGNYKPQDWRHLIHLTDIEYFHNLVGPIVDDQEERFMPMVLSFALILGEAGDYGGDQSFASSFEKTMNEEETTPFDSNIEKIIRRNPKLLYTECTRSKCIKYGCHRPECGRYGHSRFAFREWAQTHHRDDLLNLDIKMINWTTVRWSNNFSKVASENKLLKKLDKIEDLEMTREFVPEDDDFFLSWFRSSNVERFEYDTIEQITPKLLQNAPDTLKRFVISVETDSNSDPERHFKEDSVNTLVHKISIIQEAVPEATYWFGRYSPCASIKKLLQKVKAAKLPYKSIEFGGIYIDEENYRASSFTELDENTPRLLQQIYEELDAEEKEEAPAADQQGSSD